MLPASVGIYPVVRLRSSSVGMVLPLWSSATLMIAVPDELGTSGGQLIIHHARSERKPQHIGHNPHFPRRRPAFRLRGSSLSLDRFGQCAGEVRGRHRHDMVEIYANVFVFAKRARRLRYRNLRTIQGSTAHTQTSGSADRLPCHKNRQTIAQSSRTLTQTGINNQPRRDSGRCRQHHVVAVSAHIGACFG